MYAYTVYACLSLSLCVTQGKNKTKGFHLMCTSSVYLACECISSCLCTYAYA
jgi:hypothetical protein